MTPQGVRKFIRDKVPLVNHDGEHIQRIGRNWLFDDVAISRLDGFRGVSQPEETVSTPSVLVERSGGDEKLSEQIARLSELMMIQQVEFNRRQNELEETMRRLMEMERNFLATQQKLLTAQEKLIETQQRLTETERMRTEQSERRKETSGNWFSRLKFWQKK